MPHTVIVDWLNFFCSVIEFRRHRHFEVDRFISAFHALVNTLRDKCERIVLVAKEQWEIPLDVIEALIAGASTDVVFVIVRDLYLAQKGTNKERDDFMCALLHMTLADSRVLTNDKLRNYEEMVDAAKPVLLTWIDSGGTSTYYLDDAALARIRGSVRRHAPRLTPFRITRPGDQVRVAL